MRLLSCIAILTVSASLPGCRANPVRAGDKTASRLTPQTRNTKGSPMVPMTMKMLADRLRAVDPEKVDEIATELAGAVHADARLFVRAATRGPEPVVGQATETVLTLDELAIVPLLEAPEHDDPDERDWLMRMAAGSQTSLRCKVIARLDSRLSDVAPTASGERVCDTAYLLLGEAVQWSPRETIEPASVFLKRPEAARDQQIARARQSETWGRARMGVNLADIAWTGTSEASSLPQELLQASALLDRFARPDDGNSSRLSAALAMRERQTARAAVDVYLSGDLATAQKAQRLLVGMRDLAILPLVERDAGNPAQRQWMLHTAVEAESKLRGKLLAAMELLLADRRPLARSVPPGAEHVPPRRRLCDAAYLEIRKIVHLGESLDEGREKEDKLLFATDEERDAIIAAALRSKSW